MKKEPTLITTGGKEFVALYELDGKLQTVLYIATIYETFGEKDQIVITDFEGKVEEKGEIERTRKAEEDFIKEFIKNSFLEEGEDPNSVGWRFL